MATLILETVGGAVGSGVGGPVGAVAGRALGAAGGSVLGGALMGGASPRFVEGPRLGEIGGLTSTEGEPIPRVYGRARIGGTLIWATRPLEVANTSVERSSSGAKGGGQKTVRTAYSYYANVAVGLCAGEIAFVRRFWADGAEIDLTQLTMRVHTGGAAQAPDPLIVAKEGAERAPAYRGLAYVVFERLALAAFGNRIPQFAFEVIRPVGGIAQKIRAVCLIPGSTEFGLDTTPVSEDAGLGRAGRPTASSCRAPATCSPPSTRCRRSARTSKGSRWWRAGSAATCAPAAARSRPGSRPRPRPPPVTPGASRA